MKEISVTLEGEEAIFSWKEGKVYCSGYDLESEKAVLALTSYGEGMGPLLVAINACCKSEAEFMREIALFGSDHRETLDTGHGFWPKGQLLFEYYSYSPDPKKRWRGIHRTSLSERHYKRMLSDPEMGIKVDMARLKQLPAKYFKQLLTPSNDWINYALARNENCPIDVLKILSKNSDIRVRRSVVNNPSCSEEIMEILSFDKDLQVRKLIAQNPSTTEKILRRLAQGNDVKVRRYVAQNSNCPERVLKLLSQDQDEEVRLYAQEKLARSKDLWV